MNVATVFVNGCFDLLNATHCRFLERAAKYGRPLVVGLNSDRWIREHKGQSRPFYCEADRKAMLKAIRWVNSVRLFDTEQELAEIIRDLGDVTLVKGEEYKDKPVTGAEHAKRVVFLDGSFNGGITQNVIRKIREMT